jgi:hypothetical protein
VSDTGLLQLKPLINLTELDLGGTLVSDAGLKHLKGLTNLLILGLDGAKVSNAASVADLQKALPMCKITWDRNRKKY